MGTRTPVAAGPAATLQEAANGSPTGHSRDQVPDVSVIICAYTMDRWEDLKAAVGSVHEQTRPPGELIVVIDHSPRLAASSRDTFSGVTVLDNGHEPGLSGARNTGVEAATGQIVAFLDDDAVASPRWLERLVTCYADPSVLGAGGRIEPSWENGRPGWFPEEFDWVIGCTYRGLDEKQNVRNMIGANMSFRRSALVEAGGFRTGLGRTSDQPLGCEETDACIRIAQRNPGGVFVSEPSALVSHRVPATRERWKYFRARCYAEGLSKATLTGSVGSRDGLASERRHAFVTLPIGAVRAFWSGVSGRDRSGIGRAMAIVGGLAVTTAGYAVGKFSVKERPEVASEAGKDVPGRLRVLMVTPRYLPQTGGVEHHVDQVARRLTADIDVTVLTTDTSRSLPAEQTVDGVRVIRVPAWPAGKDWHVAPSIQRVIRSGHWDLVHIQSYHTAVAPTAMLAALAAGIPYVLTFHGGGHSSKVRQALREPQWTLLRPLLARARRLISVAEFEAAFYSERLGIPRKRFIVLPNGSDLPPVSKDRRAEGARVIASIGRLERYKGHHRVIRAMPRVLAQEPDVKLKVLGTGPYEAELRALTKELGVSDNVEVGSIPAADRGAMAETLASLSLAVLISEFETHPLAVIEALAVGCPVLVADTSGLRELAEQGLARSVPLDISTRRLAEAILEDLRHPRTVPDIALPSWEECANGLLSVYEEALSPRLPRAALASPVRGGSMRS